MRWTKDQQNIIDSRGGNLLVAAAAGSGKTAVLVERIIQIISDKDNPIDIDKLLVVTFTNAAASEMKERVQLSLEKMSLNEPDNMNVLKQLNLIQQSNLTTIHSFCLNIIKDNFYRLGLDPNFKIGDTQECAIMKKVAMDEVFEELYKNNDKDFLSFIDMFANDKDDEPIKRIVESTYNLATSSINANEWLEKAKLGFDINDDYIFLESDAGKILIDSLNTKLDKIIKRMESIILTTDEFIELTPYTLRYKNEYENFKALKLDMTSNWNEIRDAIKNMPYEDYKKGMKKLPKDTPSEIKKIQKDSKKVRDKCKKEIEEIYDNIFFRSEEDIKNEIKYLYPVIKGIIIATSKFIERYQFKKQSKGIIDFSDIEHFALKLLYIKKDGELIPSELAINYQNKFEEIFIDEYQDSSTIQEYILSAISKNNRFMVGDVKQSIYKFRQAEPSIFLEKYLNYSSELTSKDKKIVLSKNFRSRGEVLDCVNYIFKYLMIKEVGGLEYTEKEYLNLGASFKIHPNNDYLNTCDVHLIPTDIEDGNLDEQSDEEDLNKIEIEAKVISKIIDEMINGDNPHQVIDKKTGEFRNVNAGDIAILLRSTMVWSDVIKSELSKLNIEAISDTQENIFDTLELKTITSMLRVINDIYDDISLVGAMRSPLYNFNVDELLSIREKCVSMHFYNAVKLASEHDSELGIKCKQFIDDIKYYKDFEANNSINELINEIYNKSKLLYFVEGLDNGPGRRNNLKFFSNKAFKYEQDNYKGLHNFIAYLDNIEKYNEPISSMKNIKDESNAVKVMTIHKSKGLEFPVVICSGMGKNFNEMDIRSNILMHRNLGYGPQVTDKNKSITYSSLMKECLKTQITLENLAEEIRILYVALTRPKEKLIITSTIKDMETSLDKWVKNTVSDGNLPVHTILESKNYIDWIMPILVNHVSFSKLLESYDMENTDVDFDDCKFTYKIWDDPLEIKNISPLKAKTNEVVGVNYEKVNKDVNNIVTKIELSQEYSQEDNINTLVSKKEISVTELLDSLYMKNKSIKVESLELPSFLSDNKKINSAKIGTLVHDFIMRLDFSKTNSVYEIRKQLNKFILNKEIKEDEAKYINVSKVYRLFKSELGDRIKNAISIKKEQHISAIIKSSDFFKGSTNDELLIYGEIDLLFEENDGFVIVDYKTDYINDDNEKEMIARYKQQVELYAKALEISTGKKVKDKFLYLILSEKIISV